jgi:hypothetical protein
MIINNRVICSGNGPSEHKREEDLVSVQDNFQDSVILEKYSLKKTHVKKKS